MQTLTGTSFVYFHESNLVSRVSFPTLNSASLKARSKLPKKRRRVLPVEQPRLRRKQGDHVPGGPGSRRMTLPKQPHPANAIFKDAFGSAKIGNEKQSIMIICLTVCLIISELSNELLRKLNDANLANVMKLIRKF